MRVVASLAALFVLGGISAAAQYVREPTSTVPTGFAVSCFESVQPLDGKHPKGKHAKGSTVTSCTTTATAPVQGCPVDMRVRQRMAGSMVAVDADGVKRKVFAQRLRLMLNDLRRDNAGRKAVSATVTVHGTGGKARMQALGSADIDSMARSFNVDLGNWGEPGVSGDFLLPGFTSASRVDLESVTYEDGTSWKLGKNEACRVGVDPLMLINQ